MSKNVKISKRAQNVKDKAVEQRDKLKRLYKAWDEVVIGQPTSQRDDGEYVEQIGTDVYGAAYRHKKHPYRGNYAYEIAVSYYPTTTAQHLDWPTQNAIDAYSPDTNRLYTVEELQSVIDAYKAELSNRITGLDTIIANFGDIYGSLNKAVKEVGSKYAVEVWDREILCELARKVAYDYYLGE